MVFQSKMISGIFTRKYNIMLEEFIDDFLSKNSVYGIVYDKRFYISSQIAVFIFGIEFQKTNTHHFYKFVEVVSMAGDDFMFRTNCLMKVI